MTAAQDAAFRQSRELRPVPTVEQLNFICQALLTHALHEDMLLYAGLPYGWTKPDGIMVVEVPAEADRPAHWVVGRKD